MYCHLCHTEMSPSHDGSSGHRAARELVAAALDRLSNHLSAADSTEVSKAFSEAETDKTAKTPEAVSFCDTCNVVYAINEQTSHYRQKKHALAVLNEQAFDELVQAYIGEEPKSETPSEATDDVAFVDESEAVKTYTCHLCALEVPRVFRAEHERGSRHRASRTFALAAARRARDTFANADRCDGNKFSGKMMRKLLKAYTGVVESTENIEEPELTVPEPDSTKTEPKLTPKQYFTDILPNLPYVGTFNTLYMDNTEFVTIKIGTETLKIHVNNLNGLYNIDGKEEYYMNCRLCDGFSTSTVYYPSMGQQDKLHVMSLGHVRNVLSPVDNVHLIRKVDDTHSICHLCNLHISPFAVENHILKDVRHTTALSEALERGKDFKETSDHLKIMIYMPQAAKPSIFKNNQNRWSFGIPQQPKNTLFGAQNSFGANAQTFGNAQHASASNSGFGTPAGQNTGFGSIGGQNSSFGSNSVQTTGYRSAFGSASVQNAGFANSTAQNTGFGSSSVQNASFGSAQPNNFGSNAQSKNSLFGTTQNTGSFGNAQNSPSFGAAQNKTTGFGGAQNNTNFGTAQNASFGVAQNKSTSFGGAQNDGTSFGVANNATGFGVTQNKGTVFGAAQKITSNNGTVGVVQNSSTGFVIAQNKSTSFGAPNNSPSIGVQNNATNLSAVPIKAVGIGATQTNATSVGVAQNKPTSFGAQNNTNPGANQKGTGIGASHIASDFGAVQKAIGSIFDNAQTSSNIQKQEPEKVVDNKQSKNFTFNTSQTIDTTGFKFVQSQSDNKTHDIQTKDKNQTKTYGYDKTQRAKRSPPRRINYSSSSSSDSE